MPIYVVNIQATTRMGVYDRIRSTITSEKVPTKSRARYHNDLIQRKFNPQYFKQSFTYFIQINQEC